MRARGLSEQVPSDGNASPFHSGEATQGVDDSEATLADDIAVTLTARAPRTKPKGVFPYRARPHSGTSQKGRTFIMGDAEYCDIRIQLIQVGTDLRP